MKPRFLRLDLAAVDAMPEIAWAADAEGHIEWFNRRWFEYTGMPNARAGEPGVLQRQWARAVHPDDRQRLRTAWRAAVSGGFPAGFELRLRNAQKISRWFRVGAAPFAAGRGSGHWLGVCTDVDEHKRQGQRFAFLARAGEVLAESLDLQTTLERLLGIIVPEFGDWAAIDLFDQDDRLRTVAVTHADPRKMHVVRQLLGSYNHDPTREFEIAAALRRNRPIVLREIPYDLITRVAAPDLLPVLRALRPRSTVTIPLRAHGKTLGSLVAYWAETPRQYDEYDLPLFEELTKRAAVAIENARLYESEREIATEFQQAALPISLPDVPGVRFDGIYVPASDRALLGGDWYDGLRLGDGRIVISIGDVAGSGLAAAVIMASMRQVIRGVAQVYPDPLAMLDAADRTLKTEHPDTFVTAFVAVFDPVAHTLTYAGAGHPAPLLRDAHGNVTAIDSTGLPLGLRTRNEEPAGVVVLPESALVVFYTDGLIEADRNIIGAQERLYDAVATTGIERAANPATALYRMLLESGSNDDVVVLTLRLEEPAIEFTRGAKALRRWSFDTADADAARTARHAFVEVMRRVGACEEQLQTAELVFGELLGNVVRYAPGPIEMILDWSGNSPVLHVLDRGPGFTLVPRLPSDLLSERGRGLYIVWSLADDFNVTERVDGGAHARAVLAA